MITILPNPFGITSTSRNGTIYGPNDYTLGRLVALPPDALRVLMVMGTYINAGSGMVHCPILTLRRYMPQKGRGTLRRAVAHLLRDGLIARAPGVANFWVNTEIFARFIFTIG